MSESVPAGQDGATSDSMPHWSLDGPSCHTGGLRLLSSHYSFTCVPRGRDEARDDVEVRPHLFVITTFVTTCAVIGAEGLRASSDSLSSPALLLLRWRTSAADRQSAGVPR
ncbi:unnamed protein product [Vitrella brassicaformis CCMP3155]|uniref:Uncharacterized protein n=1 Tax=Vitrella brassicaformis (strain CCMP3155) TaxID=1169540 RepID=A0A0G4FUA5_VITBC|nr:unnamed protein product [Vitrella brassicaformis CCMP3155]|eukprot:CEM18503.1 unnamed protein product [Vitrella brassicaformis CCMP3155]